MFRRLLWVIVLAGCGGGDSSGTATTAVTGGGGSAGSSSATIDATWPVFCEKTTAWQKKCGEPVFCPTLACAKASYAPPVIPGLGDCLSARACGESDDKCSDKAGFPSGPTSSDLAYVDACKVTFKSCEGFSSDACVVPVHGSLEPSLREAARACLEKPCELAKPCLEATLGALDCLDAPSGSPAPAPVGGGGSAGF